MNNYELMRKRLEFRGGVKQESRMIQDKLRTLQKALYYSYQGCDVKLIQPVGFCQHYDEEEYTAQKQYRALITPDKLTQNYDNKVLSIPYDSGYKPGDVFEWVNTGTQWMIYLENLTEDAYFRGEIRRCRHCIKFKDSNGNVCKTWAAIRGPVETQILSIQKNQKRIDTPNLSLDILIPRSEETISVFDRYMEFIFSGRCWRVETIDDVTLDGILEVTAEENYYSETADDMINEVKDGLVIEPIDKTPMCGISGETFIKPKISEFYSVKESGGTWSVVEKEFPVTVCSTIGSNTAKVTWNKSTSGQFTLKWQKGLESIEKVIVVESLF